MKRGVRDLKQVCRPRRYPEAKVINFGTWFIFSFPIALIMLILTWLWLHCLFLGCKWVHFFFFFLNYFRFTVHL